MAVFFRRGHAVSTQLLKAQDIPEQQAEVVYPQGFLAGSQ